MCMPQLLNGGSAAALGCHPAEWLARQGVFTALAGFLRRPLPGAWRTSFDEQTCAVDNVVAAAAGWVAAWLEGEDAEELSETLLDVVIAAAAAALRAKA